MLKKYLMGIRKILLEEKEKSDVRLLTQSETVIKNENERTMICANIKQSNELLSTILPSKEEAIRELEKMPLFSLFSLDECGRLVLLKSNCSSNEYGSEYGSEYGKTTIRRR